MTESKKVSLPHLSKNFTKDEAPINKTSTSDLRGKLTISREHLESINKVIIDPENQVINDFLGVVEKYGTPQEINRQAEEASQMAIENDYTLKAIEARSQSMSELAVASAAFAFSFLNINSSTILSASPENSLATSDRIRKQ